MSTCTPYIEVLVAEGTEGAARNEARTAELKATLGAAQRELLDAEERFGLTISAKDAENRSLAVRLDEAGAAQGGGAS